MFSVRSKCDVVDEWWQFQRDNFFWAFIRRTLKFLKSLLKMFVSSFSFQVMLVLEKLSRMNLQPI